MKQKFLLKTLLLLCALIVGSGSAWAEEVTYTVSSKTSVSTSGTAPEDSKATYSQTYSTAGQATANNSLTLTLSGYKGYIITGITLSMKSNTSKGSGSLDVVVGDSEHIASISTAAFSDDSWNGYYSTSYVDINVTMTDDDYEIQEGEDVVITIAATINSLYCQSYTLTYESAGDPSLTASDLTITNESKDLTFDLYNNSSAQVINYTTSSTGAITIEPSSPTIYFSYVHDATNKTITVTPLAVTPSKQTITISQEADETYAAGSKSFTVSIANSAPLANIAALTAKTTTGSYVVTLNNAVVTYVNGNYAYIQDASGAVAMYKSNHGLTAGNVLTGTATVAYQLRNGNPQITDLSGVTPVSGDAPSPTAVAQSAWSYTFNNVLSQYFQITGATITESNSKYYVSLGGEDIQLYKVGTALSSLDLNKTYIITGFPTLYIKDNTTTKELQIFEAPEAPKTDPTITFNNGSVRVGNTLDLTTLFTSNSTGNVTYSITAGGDYATIEGSTLTGTAVGTVTVKATQVESTSHNAGEATATITVNPALVLSSITVTTPPTKTIYEEGEDFDPTGMIVTATFNDNSTEAVTGYTYSPDDALSTSDTEITISYTENGVTKTTTQTITVNEVIDYAELPFSFIKGKGKNDAGTSYTTGTTGLMQSNLGNDYSSNSAPNTMLKFDSGDDYMILKINEAPSTLSYKIKGNSYSNGTFTVLTSTYGDDYSTLKEYSNNNDNNITDNELTEVFTLPSNTRYIKWIYTNKVNGNVGLGCIVVEKPTVTLNASGYATYTSNSAIDYSDDSEFSAWAVTSIEDDAISFVQVTSAVPAGTGVLLKGTASQVVTPVATSSGDELATNLLEGITIATEIEANEYYGLFGENFVKVNEGTVKAGKALLPADEVGNVKSFTFVFNGADGIQRVEQVSAEEAGAIFNLAGQRMSKMQRGINIVNGKKVLMK